MEYETREVLDLDLAELLTNFRWKVTKKEEVSYNTSSNLYGTKTVYTMSRSRAIMNYTKITELENEYFRLKDSIKKPKKLHKPTVIFLFLLAILPGLIYLITFNHSNRVIAKNNREASTRMKAILGEVNLL